jgi:hypothetical protein
MCVHLAKTLLAFTCLWIMPITPLQRDTSILTWGVTGHLRPEYIFILLSIFVRALLTAGSLKNLTEHPANQSYRCAHPAPAVGGGSGQHFQTAPGPSQFEYNPQVGHVRAPSPLLHMYSQIDWATNHRTCATMPQSVLRLFRTM